MGLSPGLSKTDLPQRGLAMPEVVVLKNWEHNNWIQVEPHEHSYHRELLLLLAQLSWGVLVTATRSGCEGGTVRRSLFAWPASMPQRRPKGVLVRMQSLP